MGSAAHLREEDIYLSGSRKQPSGDKFNSCRVGLFVCLCNHTRVGSYTPGRCVHVDCWCGSVCLCVPGSQTSQSRDTCEWVWLCVLLSTAAKLCVRTPVHTCLCVHTHPCTPACECTHTRAHLPACAPFALSHLKPQDTLFGTLVRCTLPASFLGKVASAEMPGPGSGK